MRYILNPIQVFLIIMFTGICGLTGILLIMFTRKVDWVLTIIPATWHRFVFTLCRTKVEIYGEENLDKSGFYVYAANHQSSMDIAAVVRAVPVPLYFIVKKELKKAPVLGWYITMTEMIFIDRKNRESAMRSMQEAAHLIKRGKNVIAFPEGTRSKNGELLVFRRGSFIIAKEGNIGIVPIAIIGTDEVNPSGTMQIHKGTVKVKIGTPIFPSNHPLKSADELASYTRSKVEAMQKELRLH
ncbi:MAG: 1-acyl-sn-glycerol-3-phosphate acyltransferase [Flavobacteriales bacterium]|jgi:1-acyl-sn-glycerol-3-phosphate acyltransferase